MRLGFKLILRDPLDFANVNTPKIFKTKSSGSQKSFNFDVLIFEIFCFSRVQPSQISVIGFYRIEGLSESLHKRLRPIFLNKKTL